jgi:hypothetical protein
MYCCWFQLNCGNHGGGRNLFFITHDDEQDLDAPIRSGEKGERARFDLYIDGEVRADRDAVCAGPGGFISRLLWSELNNQRRETNLTAWPHATVRVHSAARMTFRPHASAPVIHPNGPHGRSARTRLRPGLSPWTFLSFFYFVLFSFFLLYLNSNSDF